jgi:hypothetical protein
MGPPGVREQRSDCLYQAGQGARHVWVLARKDPKGKLEGGAGMRHVKIRARDEINASGLGSFMRAAAALDRARGAAPKAKT